MSSPLAGENPVGGVTYPPLLNAVDYQSFTNLDTDWYISAAGEVVREYCGWHIAPTVTQTRWCDVSGDGVIYLPTMYLTGVTSVAPTWPEAPTFPAGSYTWDQRGWVSFKQYGFGPFPGTYDWFPLDTVRLFDAAPKHNRRVKVEFTHGYEKLPRSVAEVTSELVMRAMEKPAGVATQVTVGPYMYRFQEMGLVLSDDQKNRLQHYTLPGVV